MSISLAYGGDFSQMAFKGIKRLYNIDGNMVEKLPKFFYQTWLKDLPQVFFDELNGVIKNGFSDNIESHIGDINKKVIIILPGAFSTSASLKKIKEKFREEDYGYYALNYRLTFLNYGKKRIKIIKDTKKILRQIKEEGQEPLLFGYSYGGALAETIGDKKKIKTISLSTGNDFYYTPFTVIGKLIVHIKNFKINKIFNFNFSRFKKEYDQVVPINTKITNNAGKENIFKIIEEFSFSLDLTEEQRKKCYILKDTYSHFPLNNNSTIDAIMKGVKYFEK